MKWHVFIVAFYSSHLFLERRQEIVRNVMPESNPDSFRDIMRALSELRCNYILGEDAKFQQILNSFPPDDPDRELKANYLYQGGVKDDAVTDFIRDVQTQATTRLVEDYIEPYCDGRAHGGDVKQMTVGEALARLGFSEEQQEAFARKYGYGSKDMSLYDHSVKRLPEQADRPLSHTMHEAWVYFAGVLRVHAEDEFGQEVMDKLSAKEQESIRSWNEWQKKVSDGVDDTKIQDWVGQKGAQIQGDLQKAHNAYQIQTARQVVESCESLSGAGLNPSRKDSLERQAQETAFISQLVKEEKTLPDVLIDLQETGQEKLAPVERKTAELFINQTRKALK